MSDAVLPVEVVAPDDATLPKRVSYSQMSLYQQCPLKFYFSHVAGWKEPQTASLTGGNVAHDIVERLYRLPPEERTLERARELQCDVIFASLPGPRRNPFSSSASLWSRAPRNTACR